jgi:hypothetical protein
MYKKQCIHIDNELIELKMMEKQEKGETKPNRREAPEWQSITRSRNCQRNSNSMRNNNNDGHQEKSNDAVESFK